ncbi:hypothetical protein LG274_02760 [Micrococcus antarcticus]|uniref:hypothetical protein n=1 Tax=Micrococcus antarcticus TaxID=86171 RepID=UPI00384D1441
MQHSRTTRRCRLTAGGGASRTRAVGGWKWYDSHAAFLAGPEAAATAGLQRTRIEQAGLDPAVVADVLDLTFGLPVPKNGCPLGAARRCRGRLKKGDRVYGWTKTA